MNTDSVVDDGDLQGAIDVIDAINAVDRDDTLRCLSMASHIGNRLLDDAQCSEVDGRREHAEIRDTVVEVGCITEAGPNCGYQPVVVEHRGAEAVRVVTVTEAPIAFAASDVVGGQGYLGLDSAFDAFSCSIGFAAWSPTGDPALLSAGHCAPLDNMVLSQPSQDPAVGGPGFTVVSGTPNLGTFGFYQFGSTGGAPGQAGDLAATDISVITIDPASGYIPLPAVTNWRTAGPSNDSLAGSVLPVIATGPPAAGEVSKSGRTTGFTTGTLNSVDHVVDGWANISGQWVRGFSSNVLAAPGDSGGAVLRGNTAIGLISGGTAASPGVDQWTWSTSLLHALPQTGGYEVALDLNAPVVSSPAAGSNVEAGAAITGTAPGSESVEIAGVGATFTVPVTSGAFSFPAPGTSGDFTYKLTAVNGHSTSGFTNYALTVLDAVPEPPAAPAVTSIVAGDSFAHDAGPMGVAGAGVTGAAVTVKLSGAAAATYSATVANEAWAVDFGERLAPGSYELSVTQALGGRASEATVVAFTVAAAPAPGNADADAVDNGAETGSDGTKPAGSKTRPALAQTGADAFAPTFGSIAALALLAGGAAMIAARRRARS